MAELITMTQKELSRYEVIKRLIGKEINGTQAAKQLSLSIRQVKRIKRRTIKEGARGIIHASRGRLSNRRFREEKIEKMKKIIMERYHDFGPTFASEKLEENYQIKISGEKLRQLMTSWGLWRVKSRKMNKEYRSWRPRKEYYGEMVQFDGSYHEWFENRAPKCCLLASIDDATGRIIQAKFDYSEGVIPVFSFWKEYVETKGKPLAIYLDKFSTYKNIQGQAIDKELLTQFQRMAGDLGIKLISAHSPQAKGRIERIFEVLQDRLIKELRLKEISDIETANSFLRSIFIPQFNGRFAVLAQKKGDLHKELTKIDQENLERIFSVQSQRVVNNDFTIAFKGQWIQLSEIQPALVLRKDRVQIEERIDGRIFLALRNKYLNYTILPARPQKVKVKILALNKSRSLWKPPADHPWRRFSVINPAKRYQTSSLVSSAS